jgi:chorismate--pyruvate lyase
VQASHPSVAVPEPDWLTWEQQRTGQIPPGLATWLHDKESLTRRVQAACGPGFQVRLVRQGWGSPLYSEGRLLKMRRGEIAVIREVFLLCGEQPWVFARTLIPIHSLRGRARRLTRLGERPLGEVLFSHPGLRRGATQVARLLPKHRLFVAAVAGLGEVPTQLWGRRTLFYYAGKPLLVNEIFLPGLPRAEFDHAR